VPVRLTPLFATTTLTTSYAATAAVNIPNKLDPDRKDDRAKRMDLYFTYVVGDSNSAEIRVEFQINGGDWFTSHSYSWSSGTLSYYPDVIKLTASSYTTTGYAMIHWYLIPRDADKVRCQIRKNSGTGTVTLTGQARFYDMGHLDTV
jgi:hypothetical protein